MEEHTWTKQNITGPNEKLLELAEKLKDLAQMKIKDKLNDLENYIKAEKERFPGADFSVIDKYVLELKMKMK